MHRRNSSANFHTAQIFLDLAMLVLCYCVSCCVFRLMGREDLMLRGIGILIVFSLIFIPVMMCLRMYNVTTFLYWDRVLVNVLLSVVAASLGLSVIMFTLSADAHIQELCAIFCCAATVVTVLERFMLILFRRSQLGNGYHSVLFIGESQTMEKYVRFLEKSAMKMKIIRQIRFDDEALSSPDAFAKLLVALRVDEVQCACALNEPHVQMILRVCEDIGLTTRIILDTYDLPNARRFLSSVGTFPVITYHSVSLDKVHLFIKASFDIIISVIGLIILMPFFLLIALAIKIESPGPVLFKQTRAGLNGKPFRMLKFRSMHNNAEKQKAALMPHNKVKDARMFKMDNDPRVTKVGAFLRRMSIDELPQLVNVLKREMSIVGTRPPTLDEVELYSLSQHRRISIRPGITGMWQVSGRSNILDFDQVVQLDTRYIDEWSLLLDLKLIFKTIPAVFRQRGAS